MEGKIRAVARLGAALLAFALLFSFGSVARGATVPADTIRLLVHFRAGTSDVDHARVAASIGGVVERELRELGVTRIAVPLERGGNSGTVVNALASESSVRFAEADARVHLAFTPNDPLWANDPYVGLGQWGARKILLDRAWDLVKDPQPVIVAVIDTGVDAGHPDLAGALLPGVSFLSAQSVGCAGDNAGTDDNSHGTHVAGIIGARSDNGIGISGIARNARVLPIKALDCAGSGAVSDIAQGIVYAADHGARIINISLGSPNDSPTLVTAVNYAISHNVLVVAATGNCGQATTRCLGTANLVEYPAAYPGVLGVGATSLDDTIAPFSTQGPQVALSAPGVRIVSTTPRYATYQSERGATTEYASFSGTSQATPFVSGVGAMLLGADPSLTAAQLTDRIRSTADDLGATGPDPVFGAGRLDALRAISAVLPTFGARYDTSAVPRSVASGSTFSAKVTVTNTSQATWPATASTAVKLAYHWLDAGGNVVVWDGTRTLLPADVLPGTSLTLAANVTAPALRGAYLLRFDLVRDGIAWFSQRGVSTGDVTMTVGSGLGATYAPAATSATLVTGNTTTLPVTLTNTGTRVWSSSGIAPVHLAYHWLRPDGTTAVWDGVRAPAFAVDVQPGQSVIAQLPVVPPTSTGSYVLRLDLVQESVSWFSADGVAARDLPFAVTNGFGATYAPGTITPLLPGGRGSLPVVIRNDGLVPWSATGVNPIRLASHVLDASGAVLIWDGTRTILGADVAVGTTATYGLTIDAPLVAGAYRARIDLVREGVAWFSGMGVAPADAPFGVVADYRATLPVGPLTVSRAAPITTVAITNTSAALWSRTGGAPVDVALHWYDAAGNVLVWDGPRTVLPKDVLPGETISVNVTLGAPPAGAAAITIDLVSEGLRWFGAGLKRNVALLP